MFVNVIADLNRLGLTKIMILISEHFLKARYSDLTGTPPYFASQKC